MDASWLHSGNFSFRSNNRKELEGRIIMKNEFYAEEKINVDEFESWPDLPFFQDYV